MRSEVPSICLAVKIMVNRNLAWPLKTVAKYGNMHIIDIFNNVLSKNNFYNCVSQHKQLV